MIPKILIEIKNYLISKRLVLSNNSADGRLNSAINEEDILSLIKDKYKDIIKTPKIRYWYDFAIETNNCFYPVNIKITNTTHADNLNCKLGIYYALTGEIPHFDNEISWTRFFEELSNNMKENDKDYYFLVINKNDTSDIFVNGLKTLRILQPNGSNLPFQCEWDINKKPKERTYDEAKAFIIKNLFLSIRQRADIYITFNRLFGDYYE